MGAEIPACEALRNRAEDLSVETVFEYHRLQQLVCHHNSPWGSTMHQEID